tara:strand:+ start:2277 stop:3332 length:1056 start_codon:yes stop_codon:yes gene_type:complete
MSTILVTGCSGLIGNTCVRYFHDKGYNIVGIDNDMRAYFFGKEASTAGVTSELLKNYKNFDYRSIDIRNEDAVSQIFQRYRKDIVAVIHTAAQPSHDWAAKEPMTDFSVNAVGTMVLLEQYRKHCPNASFIFTSTNKVYGDTPNRLPLTELATRYEYIKADNTLGAVDENMSIDASKHSIFGASKVAADIMVQEYGRYFGLNTVCFRGGCLTGPSHQGAELHGFLSYLLKCMVNGRHYSIFGYKGKQVRDNIHSYDLITMFDCYLENPRPGEVYNAGGGRTNSVSIMEAIQIANDLGIDWNNYTVSQKNRIGDHMWYISDLSKFRKHYPNWTQKHTIKGLISDIIEIEKTK